MYLPNGTSFELHKLSKVDDFRSALSVPSIMSSHDFYEPAFPHMTFISPHFRAWLHYLAWLQLALYSLPDSYPSGFSLVSYSKSKGHAIGHFALDRKRVPSVGIWSKPFTAS